MLFILRVTQFVNKTFALWVLVFGALACLCPSWFEWLGVFIPYLLGIVMLGMGLSLSFKDFAEVVRNPKATIIGVIAQFLIMPALAYALAKLFHLPPDLAIGVILVGSCPGGTSSNVMTYLSKGNTALSVACTSVSTLLSPVLTPAIFYFYASQWIEIDAIGMLVSVLEMVLLPIFIGLVLHSLFKTTIEKVTGVMPLISMIAIVIIVAAVVAPSRTKIIESGLLVLCLVILHNVFGYFVGYWFGRLFKLKRYDCKAVAIEVGMQNSGLGVALAKTHFAIMPMVAVPSAIFSVWHNISGAILASIFARMKND